MGTALDQGIGTRAAGETWHAQGSGDTEARQMRVQQGGSASVGCGYYWRTGPGLRHYTRLGVEVGHG